MGPRDFFISRVQSLTPTATRTQPNKKNNSKTDIEWWYYDFFLSRPNFSSLSKYLFLFLPNRFPSTPSINFMLNIAIITYCDDEYGVILWFIPLYAIWLLSCEFFVRLDYSLPSLPHHTSTIILTTSPILDPIQLTSYTFMLIIFFILICVFLLPSNQIFRK